MFDMSDCPESPFFLLAQEDGLFECIFLTQTYDSRADAVVVSGFELLDVQQGYRIPDAPATISWKLCGPSEAYPLEQSFSLDSKLFNLIGEKSLVEKGVGREWKFEFDSDSILMRLHTGTDTYVRSDQFDMFDMSDCPESPFFLLAQEDGLFECIFLTHTFDSRADAVVVSGFELLDVQQGCRIPDPPARISWKLSTEITEK
jgi:hypothetical protein